MEGASPPDGRSRLRLGVALAGGALAGLAWLAVLPRSVQWLDAPEFVAAAAGLGLPHPPGHPSMVLSLRALMALPAGDLTFRANLFSALFAALSAGLASWLASGAARAAGAGPRLSAAAGLGAALAFAASGSATLQALSVEVYTLSCALSLGAVAAALHRPGDARTGALAAVLLALGLANHHLLSLLAVPAVLAAWWRRGTPLRAALPALALGLAVTSACYLYLPLRGARGAEPSWADTTTWDGVLWYASARVFAGSVGGFEEAHATLGGNLAAALGLLAEALSPPVLVAALAGAWVLFRGGAGRHGAVLLLLVAGNLPSKVMMGVLDPSNPDDHGYFLPAVAGVAVLAGAALPVLAALASRLGPRPGRLASLLAALAVPVLAALPLASSGADRAAERAAGEDAAEVARAWWEAAPPRALVLPSHYPVHFALMHAQRVEGARPDATEVQQSLYSRAREGRWYAAQRARLDPDLRPLVDAFLRFGTLEWAELQALAARRPVLLAASDDLGVPLADLRFRGWAFAVRPAGAGEGAAPLAAADHVSALHRLALGWPRPRIETRRVLLRHLATAAGWLGGQGRRDDAARLLDAALELAPRDLMLRQMRGVLSDR